jgi:hypothetical protein
MTERLLFLEDFLGFIRNLNQALDEGGERMFWWVGGTFFIETRRHRSRVQEFWHWLHWADSIDIVETSLSDFEWMCIRSFRDRLLLLFAISIIVINFFDRLPYSNGISALLTTCFMNQSMLISIAVDGTLSRWSYGTVMENVFRTKASYHDSWILFLFSLMWNEKKQTHRSIR